MRSDAGRKAGYWKKPLFGKPHVEGSAFVIATYTYFILGCPLAGLSDEPFLDDATVAFLPDAESLVAYFLEFPEVKSILDRHFEESDEFAAKTLSPEMQAIIGKSSREMVMSGSPGRGAEALLNTLWAITRQRQFSIKEAVEALYVAFLYGASMHPSEVERLWGVQASSTVVPLMEQELSKARQQSIAGIQELLG